MKPQLEACIEKFIREIERNDEESLVEYEEKSCVRYWIR
jgi:hypothetical protein